MIARWLKQRKSQNLVGLDIGSDTIKLLKINAATTPFKVEHFGIQPVPTGAIIKGEIKNASEIVSVINELMRLSGVGTSQIALAIPRSSVIIKTITIDNRLTSGEIESRAWIEANRLFPDLVGDIYLDFTIIGPSAQDPTQLDLMLVACRKDQVKPYVELLRQAGLTAKIIDVNSYALERALSVILKQSSEQETVAMLNMDFNLTTLIVMNKQHLIYAHDQGFDGHRLVNQVNDYINKNKSKTTLDDTDEAYLAMLKENLTSHLRHTIHFFYSSRPNINIQKIYLAGDCATISGLAMFIQREVGIETAVANPFSQMILGSRVNAEKLRAHAPELMLCCGLALSNAILMEA